MSNLADQLNAALEGRYRIERELGRGGMATVYLADDLRHRRSVAIKVLHRELGAVLGTERFLREIEVAGRQNHPHILPLYESGSAGDLLYYVMPYAEGESLRQKLDREKQLPLAVALRIAREVADALDYAHRHGLVHRDIKPENILLEEQHAVVADFGIARAIAAAGGERLTTTGLAIGTPAYMSPEQTAGSNDLDGRSDLYSLGCVLYEMLAGTPPFTGPSAESLAHQHLNVAPRPVSDIRPLVPAEVARTIQRALAKAPADRFGTAAEFAEAMAAAEQAAQGERARAPRTARWPAWARSRAVLIGAGGLVALAAFFGAARLLHWDFGASAARADENALAVLAFQNLHDPNDPERLGLILQELAITDLSELGSLKVFSSQRLHDVERQVARANRKADRQELSLRVAARAGARTLLTGTLSRLGTTWILTGQLVDVAKGTVISSARVNGGDLYTVIDDLTRQVRDGLRLRMVDRGAVGQPVREKTSPSLQALRHYVAGSERLNAWDFSGAIAELEKAVAIDSTFAPAEYRLAIALWWRRDELKAAREPLSRILARSPDVSSKDRLMAEGALALVNKCYEIAVRRFGDLTRDYADEKDAWYGLGEAWFHGRGDLAQARDAFSRALALDPEFTLASLHLADIERLQGRPGAARALLDRLIETNRVSPMLSAWRVGVEVSDGDEKRVEQALAAALRRQPNAAARRDVCLIVAENYLASMKTSNAYEVALKAHEFDPGKKDPAIYATLGRIAFTQGRHGESERWILRGLEFAPNDSRLVEGLGWLYGSLGRHRELIARARSAIARDPVRAGWWYLCWAASAASSGDAAEAARAIPQALARQRDTYSRRDAEIILAWAFSETGQNQRAEELSRKAMEEVPECESPEVYNMLGWSLYRQLKLAEAEDVFERGMALSPSHGGLQNGLLSTYGTRGKYREELALARRIGGDTTIHEPSAALAHWVEAAVLIDSPAEVDSALSHADPSAAAFGGDRAGLLFVAGDAYRRTGNSPAAIRHFRQAYSIASPQIRTGAAEGLGTCLEGIGRDAEAEQWYRKSLAVNSAGREALGGLVTVLIDQKRFEEAGRVAERCAALSPTLQYRPIEVMIRAGKADASDALLERTLSRLQSPELRRALLARVAAVHVLEDDYRRARALAGRAAGLGTPDQAPIHERYLRGYLALNGGRFAEAESAFVQCRNQGADAIIASFYIALARVLAGNHASAERELRELIERKPAHYLYYSLLSALLSDRGRFAEAVPFAERAVAMDSSRTSLTLLAWALVSGGGDAARGEALARLALRAPARPEKQTNKVYPFTPSLEQTLGAAALRRGDHRRAVQYLEEAARLRPDRPSIRRDLDNARRALAAATRAPS